MKWSNIMSVLESVPVVESCYQSIEILTCEDVELAAILDTMKYDPCLDICTAVAPYDPLYYASYDVEMLTIEEENEEDEDDYDDEESLDRWEYANDFDY